MPGSFQSRLNGIHSALQSQEWDKAIRSLESLRDIPENLRENVADLLFRLYLARNRSDRLLDLLTPPNLDHPLHCVGCLLLLRNVQLGYPVNPGSSIDLRAVESALERHVECRTLKTDDIPLCLSLLAALGRPELIFALLTNYLDAGELLTDEIVEPAFACFINTKTFGSGDWLLHFLRSRQQRHLALDRYEHLVRNAGGTSAPASPGRDKVLSFLARIKLK
jgi:hypothetical protein